jgi:hypothetical protein
VIRIDAVKTAAMIIALTWAIITMLWFSLCFIGIPTSAQIITKPYATSLLVTITSSVINKAMIIIRVAHVSWFIPKPSQFSETKKTATLAIGFSPSERNV